MTGGCAAPRLRSAAVKALIVSFYFPPAGGGGVQRPLKLAQYLPAMGIETHVLAPDDPRWLHRDEGLRMPTQAWVHRARYVGVSGGKPSEVLAGTHGIERALTHARLQLRRLVVPDENATWAVTAIPAGHPARPRARDRRRRLDVAAAARRTSSPRRSPARPGARWVADLRDSLVAHAHRRADTVGDEGEGGDCTDASRSSSPRAPTRSRASRRRSPRRRGRSARAGPS